MSVLLRIRKWLVGIEKDRRDIYQGTREICEQCPSSSNKIYLTNQKWFFWCHVQSYVRIYIVYHRNTMKNCNIACEVVYRVLVSQRASYIGLKTISVVHVFWQRRHHRSSCVRKITRQRFRAIWNNKVRHKILSSRWSLRIFKKKRKELKKKKDFCFKRKLSMIFCWIFT